MRLIITGILAAAVLALALVIITGCQSSPTREDYTTPDCWQFSDCLFRLAKSADKSQCSIVGESCRDSLREMRAYQRLEFCRTKTPAGMSESECRLWIGAVK
jgi:hypothetical protein